MSVPVRAWVLTVALIIVFVILNLMFLGTSVSTILSKVPSK
jgi:hypothetical protein